MEIRKSLREIIALQLGSNRPALSAALQGVLCSSEQWKRASSILLFCPLPDELDVTPLIGQALGEGKIVAVPSFDTNTGEYTARRIGNINELEKGRFGVLESSPKAESVSWNQLDFGLIPGIGFDLRGARLGRGKGFYDRMLARFTGLKCGVCLDQQIVKSIPREPHDIVMNCLVTPTCFYWVENQDAGWK